MKPVVAIVAQGTMGAGLAKVLTEHGLTVLTTLAGRSTASAARARDAGMRPVPAEDLAGADFLLSVLPPAHALPFARSMAGILRASTHKPVYADCNAVSPQTVRTIEDALSGTGAIFVDVGIIGLPPKPGMPSPRLYAAGPAATELTALSDYGLNVRPLDGSPGSASALKMAYAGITKGLTAVATSMVLGATRAGVADALRRELSESEPLLLDSLTRRIPDMLPKAYRWVAEMEQIAQFVAVDPAAARIYEGASKLYDRMASDAERGGDEGDALLAFFRSRY